jgi:hypothetical protein
VTHRLDTHYSVSLQEVDDACVEAQYSLGEGLKVTEARANLICREGER